MGTLLGQKVESLEMQPQEFTHDVKELMSIRLFRLDFMAVVRADDGSTQKILIEVQKAKEQLDLMRFRNYLAEQYKKQEIIKNKETTLPITTIYILGFMLPEVETACVHVARQYRDMINHSILDKKDDFIECLTHDSYVVQVRRITGKYKTKLDKLLSVFEQKNFIGDSEIIKKYEYETDDEEVKLIADILHHAGTDPDSRREIENEQEANRTINEMLAAKQKKNLQTIKEQAKALDEQAKAIVEKDKQLEAQRKLIEELKKNQKNDNE